MAELVLEHAHGYTGTGSVAPCLGMSVVSTSKSSCSAATSSSSAAPAVVYSIAAAGVVMDAGTRKQRFHLGHGDDISALVGRGGAKTSRSPEPWPPPKQTWRLKSET